MKPVVPNNNFVPLSTLFGANFLSTLLNNKHKNKISGAFNKTGINYDYSDKKLSTTFDFAFDVLKNNYRCEYVYKNIIVNKILLGRHSLNSSILLTEFRVGNSIADVVILNGTSSVYEIKTELDNLGRLEDQLNEYLKVFDKVYVVTFIENAEKIVRTINKRVGILVFSNKSQLSTYRPATSNKKYTSPEIIFDSLRRSEYLSIINQEFGFIPKAPNTLIYTVCKKLFLKIKPAKAHDYFVKAIFNSRQIKAEQKRLVEKAPASLRMLLLSKEFKVQQCLELDLLLNSRF